jgi:hypothetical protein
MLSLKKYVGSALAGSDTGQSIIVAVLGDDGQMLIDNFRGMCVKYAGSDYAADHFTTLFKMAVKIKILYSVIRIF